MPTRWYVVQPLGGPMLRPLEHEGDYEPGDTLVRVSADAHGNTDVLVRRTVHEVEINLKKEELHEGR